MSSIFNTLSYYEMTVCVINCLYSRNKIFVILFTQHCFHCVPITSNRTLQIFVHKIYFLNFKKNTIIYNVLGIY